MGFRKDWDEKSWDQFGQLPYPSRHQVSLPRQLLLDPWSLRIHPFSKLSKHSRKQKTRNCVETFLPRFPGDLLIDFSSFHMENRYFGISNFPLGPQDGYSAPPGPKILNPSCSLRDPHLCSYPHSSQYSAMFIHCVTVYAFLEAKWDIFFGKSYCLSTHYW